jgi:hypothetical protein
MVSYGQFTKVETATGFILARTLKILGVVGTGISSLALLGDLAAAVDRANQIGKFEYWRMVASIIGKLGAGLLYDFAGFSPIFVALVVLFVFAFVSVCLFFDPDDSQVERFTFFDLAINERILTITGFRAQYAVPVMLVRN